MCIVTLPPPSPLLLPPPPPPSPPILPEKGRVLATYSWMWDTFCRTFCARIKVFSLARSLSFQDSNLHIPVLLPYLASDLPLPFLQLQQCDPPRRQQLSEISQLKSRARTLHFFTHLSCKSFFGHLGHVFPAYYCHSCLICVTNSTAPSCH